MTFPTVSVVIPVYNYGHTIGRAINSVIEQSLPPKEIIVVDDGSTDNTAEIVAGYLAAPLPASLEYVKKENSGPASARNLGIAKAKGDYVILLDADDALLPHAVECFLRPVTDDPAVDLVIGGSVAVDINGKEKKRPVSGLSVNSEENFLGYLQKKVSISHGKFLVRRNVFEKVLYPEYLRSGEDQSVFAQLLALCNGVSIDEPTVRIFHRDNSLRHNSRLALKSGLKVVDAVFNPEILPHGLLKYRDKFYVNRCLSLFRTLEREGLYHEAEQYYLRAIEKSTFCVFRWSYLKKYLRMKINKFFSRHDDF